MTDIIRVLSDTVANQIAAGEVIQRPGSVIKELVENAVDAGSDRIQVIVKDAGKTLIQVVDNGCGMSENDARLCFERHATSKIRQTEDLFAIRTMGFRGEALASIASIAQVDMKTRRREDVNGTHIRIEGSELVFQQPAACNEGTSFAVRNLFYNVPARRRFLKSTSTELKHIITEFQRVALTQPGIRFSLHHNDLEIFNLPESGQRERIVHLMGKQIEPNLISIKTETSIINIRGYIGKPEKARRTYGEQYFFVNGRFMKHPYLHKAVMKSYESILPPDAIPSYFIFMELDPSHIDINIHPTKTEIKFEEERAIFQILQASVREGLGKFNITPSLDFNQDGAIDIPVFQQGGSFMPPEIAINPEYNPFHSGSGKSFGNTGSSYRPAPLSGWDNLYPPKEKEEKQEIVFDKQENSNFIHFKSKYILTPVKSGLLLIHIRRAQERIRYEDYLKISASEGNTGQKLLYPVQFDLNPADLALIRDLMKELKPLGFELEEFGGQSIIVHAIPAHAEETDVQKMVEGLLEEFKNETSGLDQAVSQKLARSLARINAGIGGKQLSYPEMKSLFDQLFACSNPQTTPGGKTILTILQTEELDQRFL